MWYVSRHFDSHLHQMVNIWILFKLLVRTTHSMVLSLTIEPLLHSQRCIFFHIKITHNNFKVAYCSHFIFHSCLHLRLPWFARSAAAAAYSWGTTANSPVCGAFCLLHLLLLTMVALLHLLDHQLLLMMMMMRWESFGNLWLQFLHLPCKLSCWRSIVELPLHTFSSFFFDAKLFINSTPFKLFIIFCMRNFI